MALRQIFFYAILMMASVHAHASSFDHGLWDHLLKKHVVVVKQGEATQVNYAGFAHDKGRLKTYLASLSAVPRATFDKWDKAGQLAFLINAYNAWTVDLVLTGYPKIGSIKELGSLLQSAWGKRFIPLLGETRSLDNIEHELIRAENRYQEPRIHFAVNCASIGCPALRPEAYTGERLTAQLDEATRLFLADRSRNWLKGDTLYLSSIFKWYRQDFERGWGGFKELSGFLIAYRQPLGLLESDAQRLKSAGVDIEFVDYDWRLNRTP